MRNRDPIQRRPFGIVFGASLTLIAWSVGAQDAAHLVVRTNVAGALVVIDGETRGEAPRRLTLAPGTHTVRVEKEGYRTWEDRIELEAGEQRTLIARLESTSGQASELSPEELLDQADRFYDEKDWQGAVPAYEQFLAAAPDHPAADYARRLARTAAERQQAADLISAGLGLLEQEEWEQALQVAERALDLDPASAEALELRNRAASGELAAARRQTVELIDEARRLLEAGDWTGALDQAQRAMHIDPASEQAMALRDQATAAADSAQSERKEQAQLLVRRGRRMLDAEAWQEALDFANQALQLDPDNRDASGLLSAAAAALTAARRLGSGTEIGEPAAVVEETREERTPEATRAEETLEAESKGEEAPAAVAALPDQASQLQKATTATVLPREIVDSQSGIRFLQIPPGTFEMGCTKGDASCGADERPSHAVTLSRSFYLAETETTRAQYQSCVDDRRCPTLVDRGSVPAPELANHPVHTVSWRDAVAFCKWIGGRLPTEAEWELAARGGQARRRYHWGNNPSRDHANYSGRNGHDQWGKTSPVKSFPPNDFGFYDMLGNVWEWVADWHNGRYYSDSPPQDPPGPENGSARILRGGAAYNNPEYLRVSDRNKANPRIRTEYAGIRCALDEPPPS